VWGIEGYGVCHYPVPVLTIEIVRRAGMRPVLSPLGDSCCYLLITLTPKIEARFGTRTTRECGEASRLGTKSALHLPKKGAYIYLVYRA